MKHSLIILALSWSTWLLCACSDTLTESGGGAGLGEDPDPQAVALIEPLAGIYDLPDNWSNNSPDEAFLEIRQPGLDGVADALLHDWDDVGNCLPQRPSQGIVRLDAFAGEVFMDDVPGFNNAVLSKENDSLLIRFVDSADIDGDGDTGNFVTISAPEAGVAVIGDLGPAC